MGKPDREAETEPVPNLVWVGLLVQSQYAQPCRAVFRPELPNRGRADRIDYDFILQTITNRRSQHKPPSLTIEQIRSTHPNP